MKKAILPEAEHLLLLAILRLGDAAYGVSLCGELRVMTGRPAALASVYKALEGMEARGLVESRMGAPSAVRGGRAKRFVRVTAAGLRAVQSTRAEMERLWASVPVGTGGKREAGA